MTVEPHPPEDRATEGPVLVTGATSEIGAELVRLLVAEGVSVRAMCRRPEQQADLAALGAAPVLADFDDSASLRAAMTGCSQVFLVTAPLPRQLEQERRAIDSAVATGVRRLVRLSAADSNRRTRVPWANAHAWADHYLADTDLRWTVLRPSAFLQNLAELAPAIRHGLLPQTTGSGELAMIDTADIAAVACRVLTDAAAGSRQHDGATYFLTGPESLSMREVAARFATHLGRDVRYVQLPGWVYALVLRLAGQSWWTAKGLRVQFADVVRAGHDVDVTYEVARLLGRPARTLDDYIEAHRSTFSRR